MDNHLCHSFGKICNINEKRNVKVEGIFILKKNIKVTLK